MLKKSVIMVIVAIMMALTSVFGQTKNVMVINKSAAKILVRSQQKKVSVVVPKYAKKTVSFPAQDGKVAYEMYKYFGLSTILVGRGETTRSVIIFDGMEVFVDNVENIAEDSTISESVEETFLVVNSFEDFQIYIPDFPDIPEFLRGLALNPGDTLKRLSTSPTGRITCPIFLVKIASSEDSTSLNRSWGIVDCLITEGATVFEIKAEDITQANQADELFKKKVINLLDFDFMISDGNQSLKGLVFSARSTERIKFSKGWNVLTIQYVGQNGLPTEEVLVSLISDTNRPVYIKRNSSGKVVISTMR